MVGHLLPYLTADDAKQQGLDFREAHGWVEVAWHDSHRQV